MQDQKQTGLFSRLSEEDKDLIRSTFKDDEKVLFALRALFLGFGVSEHEQNLIGGINTPAVRKIIRKFFIPELERDDPIGMSRDLWTMIPIQSYEEASIQGLTRRQLVEMLEQGLSLLTDPTGVPVDLSIPDPEESDFHWKLMARNGYIAHVDTQLSFIKVIANMTKETEEELLMRLSQDSNK